jgi:hypothetical protein
LSQFVVEGIVRERQEALQRVEDLKEALRWALSFIAGRDDEPRDGDGEVYEDYSGATRVAWPDEPENWA